MISPEVSQRITVLRPVLIFLILITHVHGTLYRPDLQGLSFSIGTYLYALLTGVLAICALPLLSIISGYLAASFSWDRPWYRLLLSKAKILLLPMLLWNFVLAAWIYRQNEAGVDVRGDLKLYPFQLEYWFYALTSIFRIPANPPLYFLRELFLCFVCWPVFKLLVRFPLMAVAFMLFVAYCYLSEIHFNFFIRFDIYGFFVLGMLLARHDLLERLETAVKPWFAWLLAFYVLWCLTLALYAFAERAEHFLQLMKALTLFAPLVFWFLGRWLLKGQLGRFLRWISPAAFPVFLGHCVIILALYEIWLALCGFSPLEAFYPLYWVLCMVLSFAIMGGLRVLWRALLRFCSTRLVRARRP